MRRARFAVAVLASCDIGRRLPIGQAGLGEHVAGLASFYNGRRLPFNEAGRGGHATGQPCSRRLGFMRNQAASSNRSSETVSMWRVGVVVADLVVIVASFYSRHRLPINQAGRGDHATGQPCSRHLGFMRYQAASSNQSSKTVSMWRACVAVAVLVVIAATRYIGRRLPIGLARLDEHLAGLPCCRRPGGDRVYVLHQAASFDRSSETR
ncbi:hypothetical protein V5799_015643 [Amblyomma americanum]|uniref:Uncharacterized protein n=1 Tax=Amblyomma americanum TaxID=6943 RepID=A0AAQ4F7E7_AMBAM